MDDRTTLLLALSDYRVLDVTLLPGGGRRVLVGSVAAVVGCSVCGVMAAQVKDRPTSRVRTCRTGRCRLWSSSTGAGSAACRCCVRAGRLPRPACSCRSGRG